MLFIKKDKNDKIRKQQVIYTYSDANMIGAIDDYLRRFKSDDFRMIRLSFIFIERKIIVKFKSNFETRKKIADKLREYDSDGPLLRMQRLMEADKKSEEEEMKRYETYIPTVIPQKEEDDEMEEEETGHRVNIGDVVIHFKGQKYLILAFAKHTETNKDMVIYQATYGDKQVWARPYNMFMGKVDKKKYPDVEQEYRFEVYTDEHQKKEEELMDFAETTSKAISENIPQDVIQSIGNVLKDIPDEKIKEGLEKMWEQDPNRHTGEIISGEIGTSNSY